MKKNLLFLFLVISVFSSSAQTPTLYGYDRQQKIFKIKGDGSGFVNIDTVGFYQVQFPGHLIQSSNGLIYGIGGWGDLFSIDPITQNFTILHTFACHSSAFCNCIVHPCQNPNANLVEGKDGILYGNLYDVIFSYNPTNNHDTIYSPGIPNGEGIVNLVLSDNGKIYMTTCDYQQKGHLFSFDTMAHTYDSIRNIGNSSYSYLIKGKNGMLYGVQGSTFSYSSYTSNFSTLPFALQGTQGITISGDGDVLFGTLTNSIYSFNLVNNTYTVLHDFQWPPTPDSLGHYPMNGIILGSDCKLYGMIHTGGSGSSASAFYNFDVTNNIYTKIFEGSYNTVLPYAVDQLLEVNSMPCMNYLSSSDIYPDASFYISPNPFTTTLSISLQKENLQQADFTITNIIGQPVYTKHESNLNSAYTKTLDLSYLPAGVYFLEVIAGGERSVRQLVKQ